MEDIADINDIFSSYEDVNYDNLITDLYYPHDSVDMFVEKMKSDINYALKQL